MFQSLIGFKINWNECVDRHVPGAPVFQSLIGFKINWNRREYQLQGLDALGFNP